MKTIDGRLHLRRCGLLFLTIFFAAFISGTAFATVPNDDEYAPYADEMPAPVGGMGSLVKNVKYPELAKKVGIEGKVFLLVYINEHGGVDDVKVVKGIGAGCDEAAIAAVKKTKFTPGKSGSTNIKTKLSLALNFR